tara:strand:- start:224 stop:1015 length:792 start_codon:yes stop_codon:yes gene_type:complete
MDIETCFEKLWKDYTTLNPSTEEIYNALKAKGNDIINDHVAFRTFEGKYGIEHFAQAFLALGYEAKGEYTFTEKRLFARHYEHENHDLPKIFISELKTKEFSPFLQDIVSKATASISSEQAAAEDFFLLGRPWPAKHAIYQELIKESEYAAWLYAFGFRANHFTVNVNRLNTFTELVELNNFIESIGFELNDSGGKIKGSPQDYLEQSSTKAKKIAVAFEDGEYEIPGCYYEFAKRYELPEGGLYQGFVAKSADKIFESTNKY